MEFLLSKGKQTEMSQRVKDVISRYSKYMPGGVMANQRSVGDWIQDVINDNFKEIVNGYNVRIEPTQGKRAMGDVVIWDEAEAQFYIDIKTHNVDTDFNMPNLTSVKRLADLYQHANKYFVIIIVDYSVSGNELNVVGVSIFPIEELSWACLSLGALGWGQIQITNSNKLLLNDDIDRKAWVTEFKQRVLKFYQHETSKITSRIKYFETVLPD